MSEDELDYLDRLYTQNQEFFDNLDKLFLLEELYSGSENWQDELDEPDDEFLRQSDVNANEFLEDILHRLGELEDKFLRSRFWLEDYDDKDS